MVCRFFGNDSLNGLRCIALILCKHVNLHFKFQNIVSLYISDEIGRISSIDNRNHRFKAYKKYKYLWLEIGQHALNNYSLLLSVVTTYN